MERDLRRVAAARGTSVSEVVREAVRGHMAAGATPTALERFGSAVGAISHGPVHLQQHAELVGILEARHAAQPLRRRPST